MVLGRLRKDRMIITRIALNPRLSSNHGEKPDGNDSGQQGKNGYRQLRSLILFLLVPLFMSCSTVLLRQLPERGEQAQIQIYLQPVPAKAGRITWIIDKMAAIRSDGTSFPLSLHVSAFKGADLEDKQIYIASGFPPPGSYNGVSVTIGKASLTREDGEAALLIPEEPVTVLTPFVLDRSEVLPLFLSINPSDIIKEGVSFAPQFSLSLPARELQSLTGYVSMGKADRIMVFNRQTMRITGAVSTGRGPRGLLVDTDRERIYVALSGDDAVQIIDYSQGTVPERIQLRAGDNPRALALTGDASLLLSANYGSNTVSLIDPALGVEMERVEVGHGPTSILVSRNNTRAYVTCSLSGTVEVIDLTSEIVQAAISMEGAAPIKAAFDTNQEKLFVVSSDSPDLMVIDPTTLKISDKVYIGMGGETITVDPLSGLLLVGQGSTREISIIDPSALMAVDNIELKGTVGQIAVDPQERSLLVVLPEERIIQKVDLVSKQVLGEMTVDTTPSDVAVFE